MQYIAMRVLKNLDAFLPTGLEIMKKLKQYKLNLSQWAPWRAYVVI